MTNMAAVLRKVSTSGKFYASELKKANLVSFLTMKVWIMKNLS